MHGLCDEMRNKGYGHYVEILKKTPLVIGEGSFGPT
jgi:hypothetical protein